MNKVQFFEKSWCDGPFEGDLIIVSCSHLKKEEKKNVIGVVKQVRDVSCSFTIVGNRENDGSDTKVYTVKKDEVFACFHPIPKNPDALCARDFLRAIWGNLVFGRVTRIVTRAQDCNIWMNVPEQGEDGRTTINKYYLGDNKNKLSSLSKEEIAKYITFEYDHFYGFCGFLTRKQQRSKTLPVNDKAKKPFDREVEEDLEELHVYDHDDELEEKEFHENPELEDEELKKARMYVDIDYRVEEELEKDHEFGETSFHFASNNFREPRMFTLLNNGSFDSWDEEDLFEETLFEKIKLTTPKMNDCIAGYPVKTKRGVTAINWFVVPHAFFEFWKLLMSNTNYPKNYNYSSHAQNLRFRVNGNVCHFFLDLAKIVLFNARHNNNTVDDFMSILNVQLHFLRNEIPFE